MIADPAQLWRAVRAAVAEYVTMRLMHAIRVADLTRTSSGGAGDAVKGFETEGGAEGSYDLRTQRFQHFGFASVPPTGLRAVTVAPGGSGLNGAIIAEASDDYAPSLNEGEAALFSSGAAKAVATGADIVVNGGTLQVARDTDPTKSGTFSFANATIGGIPTSYILYTPGTSTPTFTPNPAAPPAVVPPTVIWLAFPIAVVAVTSSLALDGKITDGADHFKA